jgi:hypothetical protein
VREGLGSVSANWQHCLQFAWHYEKWAWTSYVKVALKRYLSTHPFYSVEEFLTFKMTHNMCKSFFVLFVVWTLYNMCILMSNSILNTYLSVVSSFCFCVVFILLLLYLYVLYLYPIVAVTNLWLHRMYICKYTSRVCVLCTAYSDNCRESEKLRPNGQFVLHHGQDCQRNFTFLSVFSLWVRILNIAEKR